jgi:hypothetical protein
MVREGISGKKMRRRRFAKEMSLMTDAEQEEIDAYLRRVTAGSGGMPAEQVREIVAEVRRHIGDKLILSVKSDATGTPDAKRTAYVERVLAKLGEPAKLAAMYLAEQLQTRAVSTRSPRVVLQALFRWATLSFAGFFALLGSASGYFLSLALVCCALLEPVHPATAGSWVYPDGADPHAYSLRMGFSSPPAGGENCWGWCRSG